MDINELAVEAVKALISGEDFKKEIEDDDGDELIVEVKKGKLTLEDPCGDTHTLATKAKGQLIGDSRDFEDYFYDDEVDIAVKIQGELEKDPKVLMIPFSIFEENGWDVQDIEIIHQTGAEQLVLAEEKRHFTGATVFKIEESYFLFDIDRLELPEYFRPFVCELPKPVKTVQKAYYSLIPQKVKEAMSLGVEYLRQGELFFVPIELSQWEKVVLSCKNLEDLKPLLSKAQLKSLEEAENEYSSYEYEGSTNIFDENHEAEKVYADQDEYVEIVSGDVTHEEHKTLTLKGWYKVYKNTALNSYDVEGEID